MLDNTEGLFHPLSNKLLDNQSRYAGLTRQGFVLDLQIRTDWYHMMFASTFKSMINIIEYVQNINLKLKT